MAYPFTAIERNPVVNGAVGGVPILVLYVKGVASALDKSSIADSRDVGTGAVFRRQLDGRTLTFRRRGEAVVDGETGSTWTIVGEATAGPLRGGGNHR